jgi:alpha-beta hydrolase superfamily lysophospholipase
MHGSNYYDSEDWLGVAAALASGREVATFDHRGWGRSTPTTVAAQAPQALVAATRKFIGQA